jgi:hypothetical protein
MQRDYSTNSYSKIGNVSNNSKKADQTNKIKDIAVNEIIYKK